MRWCVQESRLVREDAAANMGQIVGNWLIRTKWLCVIVHAPREGVIWRGKKRQSGA